MKRAHNEGMILIGQAPARTGDRNAPLEGPLGSKLARLFGLTDSEYLQRFDRINVLREWPGKAGKGDAFPINEALAAALQILPQLDGRRIIFLGKAVALAFGHIDEFLNWTDAGSYSAAIVPHPSGINRWYNDPANRTKAAQFLKASIKNKKEDGMITVGSLKVGTRYKNFNGDICQLVDKSISTARVRNGKKVDNISLDSEVLEVLPDSKSTKAEVRGNKGDRTMKAKKEKKSAKTDQLRKLREDQANKPAKKKSPKKPAAPATTKTETQIKAEPLKESNGFKFESRVEYLPEVLRTGQAYKVAPWAKALNWCRVKGELVGVMAFESTKERDAFKAHCKPAKAAA